MKRADAVIALGIAGYHNDQHAFVRIYVENRISREVAERAFRRGAALKLAGVGCTCFECRESKNIMNKPTYESDKHHAVLSGMANQAAADYAARLQQHPSRGAQVLTSLDRASHVLALDTWAAIHELGSVHLQHRRNMSTTESLFQVVLTARDSLDLESGWFSTADEARAAMIAALQGE